MYYQKRDQEIDLNQARAVLKDAYAKVMTEENPDVLTDLKKIFKKTIPFSKRMYVASYLLKEALRQGRSRYPNRYGDRYGRDYENHVGYEPRGDRFDRDRMQEPRAPRPHVVIDDAQAANIFISIGRNRHVFPRDLVGILINVAGIDRDRIGDIRILERFSFVQLYKEDVEKAIAALNDYDYRGRRLAVSRSRPKDEEQGEGPKDDAQIDGAENPAPQAESPSESGEE